MKLFIALLALFLLGACTDPITVGSDLLEEDRTGVGETTAIPFTTRVVGEDSLLIINGTSGGSSRYVQGPGFSFGRIDEPTFGYTNHSVYLTPRLPRTSTELTVIPEFVTRQNTTIDSVVLLLPIDTFAGIYGPGRTFPYRALELAEPLRIAGSNYYSSFEPETLPQDLGYASTFNVSLTPTFVRDTANFSNAGSQPHARIRLTDALGTRLQNLSADVYRSDSTFQMAFPGIYLAPTDPSEGLVNFQPQEPSNVTPYSGLNVYYTDSVGQPKFYRISVPLAIPNYRYDYANALVAPLLDSAADNELISLAGEGSLMTEINFGDLSEWEGTIINRAVLEIPVADVEGVNYGKYPLPERLELFYRPSNTAPLIAIQDKIELIRTGAAPNALTANANFFLDGNLQSEGDAYRYEVSFSLQMQRIIDGQAPPRLYLRVYPLDAADYGSTATGLFEPVAAKDAARVLLNGPQAGTDPARIRVTFTELN